MNPAEGKIKKNIYILLIFIASFTLINWILFNNIDKIDKKALDVLSITGTIASLVALIIVLVQIARLKTLSETIRSTAESTRSEIMSFLFVSDLSKAIKLTQEIQIYNGHKQFDLSKLRMQDIKYSLIQIRNDPRLANFIDRESYNNNIINISVDISSIDKELQEKSNSIDILKLNEFMESVQNDLIDLDTRLKQEGGKYIGY